MWKSILAGTTAFAIAGTSLVYAQQRDRDRDGDRGGRHRGPGFSQEDRAAFTDARIAALKAGLRLTPEQEKNWSAFENALRDISKMRTEHRAAMQQQQPQPRLDDPVERLRRQADMLTNIGATLKRLADAQEPLYKSLDDGQKNRFRLLARVLAGPAHYAQMRGRDGRMMRHRFHDDDRGRGGRRDRGDRGDRGDRSDRGGSTGMGTSEQL